MADVNYIITIREEPPKQKRQAPEQNPEIEQLKSRVEMLENELSDLKEKYLTYITLKAIESTSKIEEDYRKKQPGRWK